MRTTIGLLLTTLMLGAGCAGAPTTMVAMNTVIPVVRSASVVAASIQVLRNPESGPGLVGSYNLVNSNRSVETLRFFGTATGLTQVTLQTGPDPARTISSTEAGRYSQLLAGARQDQQTQGLANLLNLWARRPATTR